MRKVFLEGLPKKIHTGKECIDWEKSVGYKVKFIYDNTEGELEIVKYNKNNHELIIKYKNKLNRTKTSNFMRNQIGKIINVITSDFKIKENIIKDEKRDLTILNRFYKTEKTKRDGYRKEKYYKYHCNKCGFEKDIKEINLLSGQGCSCCAGRTVVKGINDIVTLNSDIEKYIVNKNEAYKCGIGSTKKILCKCPYCGYEKEIEARYLLLHGFNCHKCGDGISYPEKLMINVLYQLNIKFIYQYSKVNAKWVNKYKYDFYFEYNNEKYIIETHGEQHYTKTFESMGGKTLEEIQKNDKNKYNLAINNGIKSENYIVINCKDTNISKLKNNILSSRLNEIFNLSNLNWNYIADKSNKSIVKEICDFWHLHNEINNEGLTTTDLITTFNLGRPCIIKYLKIGQSFGWCKYNPKEEKKKTYKKCGNLLRENISKKIEIFKDGISLGVFESGKELERQSEILFGVKLNQGCISKHCNRGTKYKGFNFNYK